MRFRMLPTAVALALATALVLTGCIPAEPVITPPPVPSATPVFASDEEALAAATEAYGKYLAAYNEIAQAGGASTEGLSELVSPEWFASETESFREFKESGYRQVGISTFSNAMLQMSDVDSQGRASIAIYVCWDLSDVRFVDSAGVQLPPATAPRQTLELKFESATEDRHQLVVAGVTPWPGSTVC